MPSKRGKERGFKMKQRAMLLPIVNFLKKRKRRKKMVKMMKKIRIMLKMLPHHQVLGPKPETPMLFQKLVLRVTDGVFTAKLQLT